jgi:hypothetical protein
MNGHSNMNLLYRCMMAGMKDGSFNENNLLAFMPFFWYNGDYDEYYHNYYVSKRARGR